MISDAEIQQIYQFALELGKNAGKLLLEAAQKRMSGDVQLDEVEKLNSVDIVTKTDEGEQILIQWCCKTLGFCVIQEFDFRTYR